MLAPSAGAFPPGHILIEPYFFDVMQYGSYDKHGALSTAQHANDYGNLTYIIYGLANRVSVGLTPILGFNTSNGSPSSSGIGLGDWSMQAQYQLVPYRADNWVPMTAVNLGETFPTGAYDRLGDRPNDGLGSGTYTTTVSLYTQKFFWMPNGRILRARLNFAQAFSSSVNVNGVSVYGTGSGFHGYAKPGATFTLDAAEEYSITRNWVFAMDLVYHHSGNTQVVGSSGVTNSGSSSAFQLAPAIEYNWTPNSGILFGVRTIPAGRNASATVTPAIAINMVR